MSVVEILFMSADGKEQRARLYHVNDPSDLSTATGMGNTPASSKG